MQYDRFDGAAFPKFGMIAIVSASVALSQACGARSSLDNSLSGQVVEDSGAVPQIPEPLTCDECVRARQEGPCEAMATACVADAACAAVDSCVSQCSPRFSQTCLLGCVANLESPRDRLRVLSAYTQLEKCVVGPKCLECRGACGTGGAFLCTSNTPR